MIKLNMVWYFYVKDNNVIDFLVQRCIVQFIFLSFLFVLL